jgi:hypothetical protein
MTKMIRKQIYIEPRQEALLKRLAASRGVSEAELIRRALDRQTGAGSSRPLPPDPEAWREARHLMWELHAGGTEGRAPRRWIRDELYEERVTRGRRSD